MGFRICYVACPVAPEELARALGLTIQDQRHDMPDGDWWVARLTSSGWSILWSEDEAFGQAARPSIAKLSEGADVYLCEVNETCMWSAAEAFRNGQSLWRITHAGDGEDRFDLTVAGNPPECFAGIRKALEQEQREDDDTVDFIFEIPLAVAAEAHGFRHDQYLEPATVEAFHILARPSAPGRKRGFFGLFARK
jgi:hypothetical protein